MLAIHKNNVSDEWKNYYRKECVSQYKQLNELAFSPPQLAQQDYENGSWIWKCLPLYDDDKYESSYTKCNKL